MSQSGGDEVRSGAGEVDEGCKSEERERLYDKVRVREGVAEIGHVAKEILRTIHKDLCDPDFPPDSVQS